MKSSRLVLYFVLVLFIASCSKEKEKPSPDPGIPALSMQNVSYGTETDQSMDVFLPAGRSVDTTKLIVLIHGGTWSSGDKADFNSYITSLKQVRPGYAIVNLNYRLVSILGNTFPAQEEDVKKAIEFIVSKRQEYKISDQVILLGASAGAHLATLQAYKYESTIKIKALIDFFGPTDLTKLYDDATNGQVQTVLAFVTGTTPDINPDLYFNSSPINFVNAQSPPTLILQGQLDPLVPYRQSENLKDKLASFGVPVSYFLYPNQGPGWEGDDLIDSFKRIDDFLKLYAD